MKTVDKYWETMESKRKDGKLPENAFDFISIHDHSKCYDGAKRYFSLISPLCIIEEAEKGNRPQFEQDRFVSLNQAYCAAKMLSALYSAEMNKKIEIVNCY